MPKPQGFEAEGDVKQHSEAGQERSVDRAVAQFGTHLRANSRRFLDGGHSGEEVLFERLPELRLDAAEVLDLVYASDQPGAILLAVVDDAGGDFTVARVGAREIERIQELEFIAQRVAANGVEVGLVLDDGRVVECAKRVADLPLPQINAGAALRLFRLLVLTFSGFRRFELSARAFSGFRLSRLSALAFGDRYVRQPDEHFILRRLADLFTHGLDGDLRAVNALLLDRGANDVRVGLMLNFAFTMVPPVKSTPMLKG